VNNGLIGRHLSHSFSKLIHEQLQNETYELYEVEDVNELLKNPSCRFFNVTIPYKQAVIPLLDELDDAAKEIGAVNTIINTNGILKGYNTDLDGFLFMLDTYQVDIKKHKVAIFGNGGASKMIQYALKDVDVKVFDINDAAYDYNDKDILKDVTLIINATPHNMYPNNHDEPLISKEDVPSLEVVIDLIYNPYKTPLMMMAPTHHNGLLMLVYQAVKASQLAYNTTYSMNDILKIYQDILMQQLNIILIGMPMSGKSYLSRKISDYYKKELIDTDSIIEADMGLSITELFKTEGEAFFRRLETSLYEEVSLKQNTIISPGGGVILNEQNMFKLKQNSVIIFIDMPLDILKECNYEKRPLINSKEDVINLYNKRYPLYKKYADITVKREGYNDDIVHQIIGALYEHTRPKWTQS
jgi:shikimate dehydrogenase